MRHLKPRCTVKPSATWRISSDPGDRVFSSFDGAKVRLFPSKISFAIPRDWLEMSSTGGRNVYVSPADLESVSIGANLLSKEYASICNAVFPYDRCATSAGRWKWDYHFEIHLRVYDIAGEQNEVMEKIESKAPKEMVRVTGMQALATKLPRGDWNRILITGSWRNDEDPPGPLYFDCYARPHAKHTIIFALMYMGSTDSNAGIIDEILRSTDFSAVGK
jgi:hypothetical protein